MSANLKFARNLLLDTLVIGSFVLGISWVTPLGVILGLGRTWPQSPAKRRPHLVLILLCVLLFFANFWEAWKHGALFTRTAPEAWLTIVCTIAWVMALIGETVCWREDSQKIIPDRTGSLKSPDSKASKRSR